jgi:hypothetical protein
MPIARMFDPYTGGATGGVVPGGGGGSTYDVSPPAATTQAKAAGAALTAHTFAAFTGADAGSIDGYAARVVNAVGSTAWSGSGLGAWTPSGDADGSAGVLALDATIGGVVVATALHDYSRAAAGGGASPDTFLDIAGVTSYDFLTTGGSSGSGGEGNHTVAGLTWSVSWDGTSGPTVLRIVNGVIEFQGNGTTGRANIHVNMQTAGAQLGRFPMYAVVSVENAAASQPLNWAITQNGSGNNQGNEAQFLLGTRGSGAADDTSLLTRENTTSSPAFYTVKAWDFVLTDITTTSTRMACRIMGGSWQPSWDQGTATLPNNLANLTNHGARQSNDFANANTPQNRNYLLLKLRENCDVRAVVYDGSLS